MSSITVPQNSTQCFNWEVSLIGKEPEGAKGKVTPCLQERRENKKSKKSSLPKV